MSFCQQRDISALSPRPASHGVRVEEKGPLERGCFYTASGIMGSLLLTPPPFPNVGSRLNAIYFETSRKVCIVPHISCCNPWLWGSNMEKSRTAVQSRSVGLPH
ncbi:hypothetical protein ATANTOWER_031045 [Ataeniobius toweri]|uniref:Uncharacterized protein n=1 Tax=Ataeniobius toweri TaxID=208326 RepID=A0ABU7C4C6_9TELE|nr:hypothetical protein [Ataeniobius toweri]